ncbi:MAG: hypothetical protein Q9195_002509 [Heterodermia aff. obscurata]
MYMPTIIVSGPDDHAQAAKGPTRAVSSLARARDSLERLDKYYKAAKDKRAQSPSGIHPSLAAMNALDDTKDTLRLPTTRKATKSRGGADRSSAKARDLFEDIQEPSYQPAMNIAARSVDVSPTPATNPFDDIHESSHHPAMDIEAGALADVQFTQQQEEAPAFGTPTPLHRHRRRLTRIAVSDGQRIRTPTPPPRPETPLIDLDYEEPSSPPRPTFLHQPIQASNPDLLLDLQETLNHETQPQILVAFDPLLMCPCNLDGHPCMLPLRCRYTPGIICTKFVSCLPPPPSPLPPQLTHNRTATAPGNTTSPQRATRSAKAATVSGVGLRAAISGMIRPGMRAGRCRRGGMGSIIGGWMVEEVDDFACEKGIGV